MIDKDTTTIIDGKGKADVHEDLVKSGVIDPTKVTRDCPPERRLDRRPPSHH